MTTRQRVRMKYVSAHFLTKTMDEVSNMQSPSMPSHVSSADAPNVQRGSVWFNDGNLVLEAEGVQFRVHQGLLAANSPVFNDMASFPQPNAQPNVDGCPIVHMQDAASDLEVFLKAMYDRSYVSLLR